MSNQQTPITSRHRHLVPALLAWLWENTTKPHVQFTMDHPGVVFPAAPAGTAMIQNLDGVSMPIQYNVANMSPDAMGSFKATDEGFSFQARFNSRAADCFIPYESVFIVGDGHGDSRLDYYLGLSPNTVGLIVKGKDNAKTEQPQPALNRRKTDGQVSEQTDEKSEEPQEPTRPAFRPALRVVK